MSDHVLDNPNDSNDRSGATRETEFPTYPLHRFTGRRQDGIEYRPLALCTICGVAARDHDRPTKAAELDWSTVQTLRAGDELLLFVNDPAGNLTLENANAFRDQLKKLLPTVKFQVIVGAQAVVVRSEDEPPKLQRDPRQDALPRPCVIIAWRQEDAGRWLQNFGLNIHSPGIYVARSIFSPRLRGLSDLPVYTLGPEISDGERLTMHNYRMELRDLPPLPPPASS